MNYYIASSYKNKGAAEVVAALLSARGCQQTYDWTKNEPATSTRQLKKWAEREWQAVREADVLIVLSPAGKGSHVAMGMALAAGKNVYLYAAQNGLFDLETTNPFYFIDEVKPFVGSIREFCEYVIATEQLGK